MKDRSFLLFFNISLGVCGIDQKRSKLKLMFDSNSEVSSSFTVTIG